MTDSTPPVDIVDRPRPLTVEVEADRCDARVCGAQAFVYAEYVVGSLAYCGHHGTEYLDGLRATAVAVIDMRHLIP